ncbi:MAG TPA: DUF2231 domain-containing protein [Intrasporangium sp.]|uniref:DUF2231 domain-containing protein n=1 Tax=Intrasporangium sp. TaxID=1925024 RepID=UPI002B477289|nr:DUF2231 domain-containing protein [Intrasporangium sp.]HKX68309.1 DUF2231 domain-containing protein [Intrasporangium sp.]
MSADQPLSSPDLPPAAKAAVGLENDQRLDPAVAKAAQLTHSLRDSATGSALRGEWMGHALHPALTDLPIGLFTAAAALDLLGGKATHPAAQKLVGLGLLSAVPTALTGWAEWSRADHRAQRVGIAHAALNVASLGLYAGSWMARRRSHHGLGAALSLAGSGITVAAAYLGGHLVTVREVASRHPAFTSAQDDAQFLPSGPGAYDTHHDLRENDHAPTQPQPPVP